MTYQKVTIPRKSGLATPSLPEGARESAWTAADGLAIRRLDLAPDAPRGSLLFFPGRGDFYEKYLETLDHWRGRGWRVTAMDWRGQGGSGRLGGDDTTGHIEDFAQWVDDLADLWSDWRDDVTGPHVIVGHSMGGHLVLRALAEGRIDPAAAVLIAPMLGFRGPPLPKPVLHGVAKAMARLGRPDRPAWTVSEKPGARLPGRQHLLTNDDARYAAEAAWRDARPELRMGPGSWRWVERAYASCRMLDRAGVLEAIDTPVLLLGTTADGLVAWPPIQRAAERIPNARLVKFGPEARHELLREIDPIRDRAIAEIDAFLEAATQ